MIANFVIDFLREAERIGAFVADSFCKGIKFSKELYRLFSLLLRLDVGLERLEECIRGIEVVSLSNLASINKQSYRMSCEGM